MDSDHMPLILEIANRRNGEEVQEDKKDRRIRISWNKEVKRYYKKKTEEISWVKE